MKTELLYLWRWTVEGFCFALVLTFWLLLFNGAIWGSKLRYHILFTGSFPIMVLLFVTALLSLRRHRWHAVFGFAVFLVWSVWALLPRL